jgi:hypothetical protein
MCLLEQSVVSAPVVDSNVYGGGRDAEVAAGEAGAREGGGHVEGSEGPTFAGIIGFFDEGAGVFLVVGSRGVLFAGVVLPAEDSGLTELLLPDMELIVSGLIGNSCDL